jgi:L-asparaginase type II
MIRTRSFPVAAVAALLVLAQPVQAQDSLPAVHVIATGGTISNTGGARLTGEELVKSLPGIDRIARVTVEQFSNVASGSISHANWRDLSVRINELYRTRPELRGVVITHGTDTMEETAYFLDLTVASCRPVIVTGAMRQATAIGADGPANLFDAIATAASASAERRGTMVLLNDEIFAARDVTKIHTTRPDAFDARTRGPLGDVTRGVEFYHPAPRTACDQAQFHISPSTTFPRVDIVYVYIGADSVIVDALVNAGARGIVVASAGAGATTPALGAALRRARGRGVSIVSSSRTGSGSVGGGGRGQAGQAPQLGAGDLTPQKARIRLMLALGQSADPEEIARLFRER